MRRTHMLIVVLCLSAGVAWAGDYVAEDMVTPGKFRRYLESMDPTMAFAHPGEILHAVSEANTPAQRAINLGQPHAQPPVPPSVPVKYRKIVSGLVVEMDAAEKEQVDNGKAAQDAVVQQFQDELKTKDICKEDLLAKVTQFLANREANKHTQVDDSLKAFQAEIDAMPPPNQAVAKDFFTKANVRMHAIADGVIDDAYVLFNNMARCLLAARKVRG